MRDTEAEDVVEVDVHTVLCTVAWWLLAACLSGFAESVARFPSRYVEVIGGYGYG